MKHNVLNIITTLFLLLDLNSNCFSQNSFDHINYQLKLKDATGNSVSLSQPLEVRFTIGNNSFVLFQEVQQVNPSIDGIFSLEIGNGTPTGNGVLSNLSLVNNAYDSLYLKVELNVNSSGFFRSDSTFIRSTPFSLYSLKNLEKISTNKIKNINNSLLLGGLLHYQSGIWVSSNDSLGVNSIYSNSTGNSNVSDTANFANISVQMNTDTSLYSYNSLFATNALNSDSAVHSDTTNFTLHSTLADSAIFNWHLKGDYSNPTYILGTRDNNSLLIKTNNTERIKILSNGQVALNNSSANGMFNVDGINGFLFVPKSTNSIFNNTNVGSVLKFSSGKMAFNVGYVSDNRWLDTTNMAKYSFAAGNNVFSDGQYASVAMGDSCYVKTVPPPSIYAANPWITYGFDALALGKNCVANGTYAISIGYACEARMYRNVAIGHQCVTKNESANIAMGYKATASGSTAASFGYMTLASGTKSTAFGNLASTNGQVGSFVYGDASTIGTTNDSIKNSTTNQFLVRASGGVIFYSDTFALSGVQLMPGSGSWSSLSDSASKVLHNKPSNLRYIASNIPIYYWNYKAQSPNILHIGPTAQMFSKSFHLGENSRTISTVDLDGVVLQNIIELNTETEKFKSIFENFPQTKRQVNYDDLNARVDKLINQYNELNKKK